MLSIFVQKENYDFESKWFLNIVQGDICEKSTASQGEEEVWTKSTDSWLPSRWIEFSKDRNRILDQLFLSQKPLQPSEEWRQQGKKTWLKQTTKDNNPRRSLFNPRTCEGT